MPAIISNKGIYPGRLTGELEEPYECRVIFAREAELLMISADLPQAVGSHHGADGRNAGRPEELEAEIIGRGLNSSDWGMAELPIDSPVVYDFNASVTKD